MVEVYIKYNPYRLKTEIKINGQALKGNSKLKSYAEGEKRLQEWVDMIPEILREECHDTNFRITFRGPHLDYMDVLSVAESAPGMKISCTYEGGGKGDVDRIKGIKCIFEKIKNGPIHDLISPKIETLFSDAMKDEFQVHIIATMSAGKSTLINAMLRKKLLPSSNKACTATIVRIKDCDSDTFDAEVYDKAGNVTQRIHDVNPDYMEKLNTHEVHGMEVKGRIPFVSSEKTSLVLIDTPGTDSSRSNGKDREITYEALDSSPRSLVLFIFDGAKALTTGDDTLFKDISKRMRTGGRQSKDRYIFILSKADMYSGGKDSIKEQLDEINKYLVENGLSDVSVFPVSQEAALFIRTILTDKFMETYDDPTFERGAPRKAPRELREAINYVMDFSDEYDDELHLEKYVTLRKSLRDKMEADLREAKKAQDVRQEALIHTGINLVEEAIKIYVEKYALSAKIKQLVETFMYEVESRHFEEQLRDSLQSNEEKRKKIVGQIEQIRKFLADGDKAKEFRHEINKIDFIPSIRGHIEDIRDELLERSRPELSKAKGKEFTKEEANSSVKRWEDIANNMQAELRVKLSAMFSDVVQKTVSRLLDEYKKRLSTFADNLSGGSIEISPFDLMQGEMQAVINVSEFSKTKQEKKEKWVDNDWQWYNPFSWHWPWQDNTHKETYWVSVSYIDAYEMCSNFFGQINKGIGDILNKAESHCQKQAEEVKRDFGARFEELDKILMAKLDELASYQSEQKRTEEEIGKTRRNLEWLEKILAEIQEVLEV